MFNKMFYLTQPRCLGHKTYRTLGIGGQTVTRHLEKVKISIYRPPGTFQVIQMRVAMLFRPGQNPKWWFWLLNFANEGPLRSCWMGFWTFLSPSSCRFDGTQVASQGMCTVQVPGGNLSARKVPYLKNRSNGEILRHLMQKLAERNVKNRFFL